MYHPINDEIDPETLSDNFVSLGKRWIKSNSNLGAADVFPSLQTISSLKYYNYLYAFKNLEFKLRHTDYIWNGLKVQYRCDEMKFVITAYNTNTHKSLDIYWCNYTDTGYYTTHGYYPEDGPMSDLIEFKDNINAKYILKYENGRRKFVYADDNHSKLLDLLDKICYDINPHPNLD